MNLTNLKIPLLIIDVEIVHYIFNGVLCIILWSLLLYNFNSLIHVVISKQNAFELLHMNKTITYR